MSKPQKYKVFTAPARILPPRTIRNNRRKPHAEHIGRLILRKHIALSAHRPDSSVKKLMQKQSELESKLNGSFTEEQQANFEQYLSLCADLLDANTLDSFITGFRLGARFAHEIFLSSSAPYVDLLNKHASMTSFAQFAK